MSPAKDMKRLVRDLGRQGWEVTLSGSGHYRAKPPSKEKRIVFFPCTPSAGRRSMENTVASLRREGYEG
jgi:hypothetical protein